MLSFASAAKHSLKTELQQEINEFRLCCMFVIVIYNPALFIVQWFWHRRRHLTGPKASTSTLINGQRRRNAMLVWVFLSSCLCYQIVGEAWWLWSCVCIFAVLVVLSCLFVCMGAFENSCELEHWRFQSLPLHVHRCCTELVVVTICAGHTVWTGAWAGLSAGVGLHPVQLWQQRQGHKGGSFAFFFLTMQTEGCFFYVCSFIHSTLTFAHLYITYMSQHCTTYSAVYLMVALIIIII